MFFNFLELFLVHKNYDSFSMFGDRIWQNWIENLKKAQFHLTNVENKC